MSFSLGIIGVPNSGKTSLFNALTSGRAQVSTHLFSTVEPNVGIVQVPDERLAPLCAIFKAKKTVPAEITFVDIAGLVKGSSRGEGLGNQFLARIRETDAVVVVLRCFQDPQVASVEGTLDPVDQMETLSLELALADLAVVEKSLEKREKAIKVGEKGYREEAEILKKVYDALSSGRPARAANLSFEEKERIKHFSLLTLKPVLYVANVGEETLSGKESTCPEDVVAKATQMGSSAIAICARVEAELAELPPDEAEEFAKELGVKERGLEKLIGASFGILDLVTFFTGGDKEVRAWTIPRNTPAVRAAGKVHTDMERGFIRAEVISYPDLVKCGNFSVAREKGLLRVEGKEYLIQEGDVVHIRFNV